MQNQKSQMLDGLKKLILMDARYSARLNPAAIESGRMSNERHLQHHRNNAFTHYHESSKEQPSLKNSSARHAKNFLVNAVAISICMTALILSIDSLPIIFKVIAFCGSLMVGFIIEIMLNGDEYE